MFGGGVARSRRSLVSGRGRDDRVGERRWISNVVGGPEEDAGPAEAEGD
jgi:hypothetical protein